VIRVLTVFCSSADSEGLPTDNCNMVTNFTRFSLEICAGKRGASPSQFTVARSTPLKSTLNSISLDFHLLRLLCGSCIQPNRGLVSSSCSYRYFNSLFQFHCQPHFLGLCRFRGLNQGTLEDKHTGEHRVDWLVHKLLLCPHSKLYSFPEILLMVFSCLRL